MPTADTVLFLGLALDAALGEMGPLFRIIPHPVVLVGRASAWLDQRFNRPTISPLHRRLHGVFVVLLLVGAAAGTGFGLLLLARRIPFGWGIEVAALAVLVAQRSLFSHVRAVSTALKAGGVEHGREAVRHIVGRDVTVLDDHGVARAAIESLAENFADGVVAPVFWFVLLGLPGLFAYKTANTLDSMIGYRSDSYRDFGWAAARLDDLLNLVPARLSGLIVTLAALFAPGGNPLRAARIMITDGRNHPSPNSGWPEAAMAGGLDLALGGPRRYLGNVVEERWIGRGTARATSADIDRALVAYIAACLINAGLGMLALRGLAAVV